MRFGWKMESTTETSGGVSSTQAVLLGALAPGVNGPTWITLKLTFLMMGMCLAVMLGLAFSSSDSPLLLHVTFLVLICVTLFLLLSCRTMPKTTEFGYWLTIKRACKIIVCLACELHFRCRFLAQTGLVTVEHQMREMGLVQNDHSETTRKNQ
ncbi:hypothetical protein Ahy_A10g051094 isoform A [Arachis hypogaea]|uniref:Uncharacterized protein n=1 Tax=Arachis hypogaea TaxID=3818 RepID=A0A445BBI7_ARAHY|nr:hypothetical protein Ahy_A10g051094 isoform A [Arachis hypogaea]